MDNRWSDTETEALTPLDLLVYQSRLIGADPSLVLWGGGNTSLKLEEKDHRDRPTRVLRVKGTGSDMKNIQPAQFPALRLDDLLPLSERSEMSDEEMVEYLGWCLLDPSAPRPSIETLLHAFLPQASVVHTHADAVLSLTNTQRPDQVLHAVYGQGVVAVPYRRPGFLLSREVAQAALERDGVQGVALLNHGLVTWGPTLRTAYDRHIELVAQAEEFIQERRRGKSVFGGAKHPPLAEERRHAIVAAVAPTLRGLVGRQQRMVLRFEDGPDAMQFAGSALARELAQVGAATPDHLLHTKRTPLLLDVTDPSDADLVRRSLAPQVERYAQEYGSWFESHRQGSQQSLDSYPRVVVLPGVGLWTTGRDMRAATVAADIFNHTIAVMGGAQGVDGYASLSQEDAYHAEYWPLELYKLTLLPPEKELARRVALITGAARGIGRAIARRFAAEGAHLVLTDVDEEGVLALARQLNADHGQGRAVAVRLDVTREEATAAAFDQAVLSYGGLDILVSNAGIAPWGSLEDVSLSDWERSLAVNATGHFLVARQAVRILKEQGLGGSLVFIATKNVTAPGRGFGAYSAAKAAEVQLARVLALENGADGIRCNIINPDAVFQNSALWSPALRQERARAHGVPVEELEEFYRKRNLLQTFITAEDVAEAALYLASDRSSKTTGCILTVDGGLPEAFPR